MKTESLNKQSVDPKWYVVDADGQILGRFASKLADRLRGKDKPTFTPHTDGGDFVVVINAEKVAVTGDSYFFCIDDHHKVSSISMRSKSWFIFSTKPIS